MNVVASLKRKYGPLPAWAWLGLLAVVLVVYRYFRGGGITASGSSDTGAATADGAGSSSSDTGRPAIGSGDSGSGLAPTDQTPADPGLTGPGTAVVFDPLTGTESPDPLTGGPAPRTQTVVPPTARAATTKKPAATDKTRGGKTIREAPELITEHGLGQMKKKRTPPRPKSSRGQTAPRPTLQTNRADAAAVAHPASVAHEPSVAPTRTQQNAAVAVDRPRSDSSVHVDTGARASSVGTTTSPATYAKMGRKMELD